MLREWAEVAEVCEQLKSQGFTADIVIGHIGWEALLFLKTVWPNVSILGYFEYFYSACGNDAVGFDPEFPISDAMEFASFPPDGVALPE